MSKKLVRWTARALVAGLLVATTAVLGAGAASADVTPLPPGDGGQTNSNSWIWG